MRRLRAKALAWTALTLVSAGVVAGTGCTAKQPTELVPGLSSQMVVPKDLTAVTIQVKANGAEVFCKGYQVAPTATGGVVNLPGTLGTIPAQSPDTVVTVTIRGYDTPGSNGDDFASCNLGTAVDGKSTSSNAPGPRILRRSVQTYVDQKTLFLPMPLSYSCEDMDCSCPGVGDCGKTCAGGQCVDTLNPKVQAGTLVEFDPTLIDGTGVCFSPKTCLAAPPMGDLSSAVLIDSDKCIYGFPFYAQPQGMGINVQVFYQDWQYKQNIRVSMTNPPWERVVANAGELEILNEDPANCGQANQPPCEGYTVLGPSEAGAPQSEAGGASDAGLAYDPTGPRIQLAPGLCNLVKAGIAPPPSPPPSTMVVTPPPPYHTISDVQLSSICPPKVPLLPICAAERSNSAVLPDASVTQDGVCNVGLPLTPTPAALYLVMDNTAVMHGALGPGGSVTELSLSFNAPVFKRTYAGFRFFDGFPAECSAAAGQTTAYVTPDIPLCPTPRPATGCPLDLVGSVQAQLGARLAAWTPPEQVSTTVCFSDADCALLAPSQPYCYIPNCPLPDAGMLPPGCGSSDAGADAGTRSGNCVAPQAMDLTAAMQLSEGAYAEVAGFIGSIPAPGVAGVMYLVNRVPETSVQSSTGDAGTDGGAPDAGPQAFPQPVGALDCPAAPASVTGAVGTPGGVFPPAAVQAQQIIETEAMSAYNGTNHLQTYFVILDNDRHDPSAFDFFSQIQTDLQQPTGAQPVIVLDARNVNQSALMGLGGSQAAQNAQTQVLKFAQIMTSLGTCLYEIPGEVTPGMSATIQYSAAPPGVPAPPQVIPMDTKCSATTAGGPADGGTAAANGWNYDGTTRIRICGKPCADFQAVVEAASAAAFMGGTALDVPVTITPLCNGTSGSSDATTGGGG